MCVCESLLTENIKSIVRTLAQSKVEFHLVQPQSCVEITQIGKRVFHIHHTDTGAISYHSIGECFQ